MTHHPLKIGMVAGELSGDGLGAGLLQALQAHCPEILSEGIGGAQMLATGFASHYPLETLSVMGLAEVMKSYSHLKHCQRTLRHHFLQHPPDIFIGIDAPDFNLSLEQALKAAGIPTVHYVSPSVWAWRRYRWRKIAKACDLMLTLFPFETEFYQQYHIPACFVGHPLADAIPLTNDPQPARFQLGLPATKTYIALLPGSRLQEVRQLGPPFLQTAQWLFNQQPHLHFLVPLASGRLEQLFIEQVAQIAPNLPLHLFQGQSQQVMAAADVILTASGTATLEAMLLKRPMVVAYRLSQITYQLAKWLVTTRYFALPNLLAGQALVPEFLQHQVIPEKLGASILHWLNHPTQVELLQQQFTKLHHQLRQSANQQAAKAVLSLL